MKVITCASYYGSGSSALTDLLSEYDVIKSLTDYEFRFLHDLDGVMDLEYHLCDCHNRHNSGHALKRFFKLSKFNAGNRFVSRYEPFFNNNYMKLTKKYIEELTDLSFHGWWFYDLYDKGELLYYVYQSVDKFLKKITQNKKRILTNEITLCSHPSKEKFIQCTQEYVHDLLMSANDTHMPYIMVDQIVSSQNVNKIYRYFKDELFIAMVDRDPRDIYTLSKFYWHDSVNPYNDVDKFCDWYKYIRTSGTNERIDNNHVIKIHFEDLIFNYSETVEKIECFIGLSSENHHNQFTSFNPKKSVNNTKVWERHDIDEDIRVIEDKLVDYLYDFDSVKNNELNGINEPNAKIF